MRYLKTFESINFKDELQNFCNAYLAYLLDEDFVATVYDFRGNNSELVIIIKRIDFYTPELEEIPNKKFNWNQVKDYLIPFIYSLNNSYEILGDKLFFTVDREHDYNYKIENILNDNISEVYSNKDLCSIWLKIKVIV